MNSLLPPNATQFELAFEQATRRVAEIEAPVKALWNPDTCPEALLPYLAWSLGLDTWKNYWPIAVRRSRVKNAIAIMRRKGTAAAVRDVIASFGGAVELVEWWQQTPPGPPHTFQMVLTLSGAGGDEASAQFVTDVLAEVDRAKPTRSHYTFTQGLSAGNRVGVIAVARVVAFAQLNLQAESA